MGVFKVESCRMNVAGCMDLVYYDDEGHPAHEIMVDDEELNNLKAILLKMYPE